MSQVGTIKGYHDGASYNLADIYDEKMTEYNISAGTSARDIFEISFNTTSGIAASYASDFISSGVVAVYHSATFVASTSSTSKPATNIIQYLSSEHSASGYALNCATSVKRHARLVNDVTIMPLTKDSSGNYVAKPFPSYELDGWFFIDTSSSASTTQIQPLCGCWLGLGTSSAISYGYTIGHRQPYYSYTASSAVIHPFNTRLSNSYKICDNLTYVRDLDRSVFNAPFHLKIQWFHPKDNPLYRMLCYVNGELYAYSPITENDRTQLEGDYYQCALSHITVGGAYTFDASSKSWKYSYAINDIHVTNFKVSLLEPIYTKVPVKNMLIRHNGSNCYIPLTTNKANTSTPCLAVRHGSTNYYAIK